MKKSNKILIAVLITAVLLILAATFIGAATIAEKPMAIINYIVGITEEEPEGADVNEDGEVNIFDALIALKQSWAEKAYVSYISLDDDSYSLDFKKDTFEYTVKLPEGHPAVPQVSAEGVEGVTVEIQQAFLTNDATSAKAYVVANNGKGTVSTYTITFEKTAEAGFELQYDDRYTFNPTTQLAEGEAYTFASSNPEIIAVDTATGEMTAKQVSKEDVTITATCGDVIETLLVTEVEKAHVNLFLLTGQSNGQGCYGNADDKASQPGYISYANNKNEVPEIGVDGAVYSYDVYPYKNCVPANTFYDMNNEQRTGPAAALGKAFYDLSGEKVVFLQTAYSGAPIQSWLDPETRPGYAGYYGATSMRNFYDATQKAYADLMAILDENNFEVVRTCNFWWHGGTATVSTYDYDAMDYVSGKTKMTDKEYYDLYMMMHEDMIRDFGLDYDFMILNRIQKNACYFQESKDLTRHTDLVPIRASQIALTNLNEDIIMASTKAGEYARMYSATQDPSEYGYNFVGLDNVHFNQIGHNATGEEAGTSAFYALKSLFVEREAADHVEIIDTNGRDRLTSTDTIELKVGSTYRIAGLAYPIYSEDITYTSSKESVATVNEFGLITAVSDGYAMITVTSESGKTESVEVYVYSVQKVPTTYRWEFVDDLNTENDDNALTLSPEAIAKGVTESSYTLDGSYSASATHRPDFLFEKPISVSSNNDWSFEWKADLANYSVLAGQTPAADSEGTIDKTSQYGCIYLSYNVEHNQTTGYHAMRFQTPDASKYYIKYGDYESYNEEPNTWKLTYTAETKMLKLEILLEDVWTLVNDVEITKAYDFNFTNLFGRYSGGSQNFRGTMEYLEIKCVQEVIVQEKNYRYEFDGNLLSSKDKNDLTLSPDAIARGSSSDAYTLTDNMYTETASTKLHRADFAFEKPVRVSNKIDWTIEWKADLDASSQLLGQSLTDAGKTQYGCIYLAYGVSGNGYSLRFKTADMSSSATGYRIAYGDYKNKNTSLNTWKLEHKADTQVMTLYFKGTSGWETVGQVSITSDYDFTFTNLFGTYQDSAFCNLNGTVDYVDIYTKETIYQ